MILESLFTLNFKSGILFSLLFLYFLQTILDTERDGELARLGNFFFVWILAIVGYIILLKMFYGILPVPIGTLFGIVPTPDANLKWYILFTGVLGGLLTLLNGDRLAQWNKLTNYAILFFLTFLAMKLYFASFFVGVV